MTRVRIREAILLNVPTLGSERIPKVSFTKEMKSDYTILAPMMAPIHFKIISSIMENNGYHIELLENCGPGVIEEGLKYVHNDTCYPALLVIGQMLDALKSGKYNIKKTALLMAQTGGGCRASNYIYLLRRALKKAGYDHIPVISFSMTGMEKNSGFHLSMPLLYQMVIGIVYGDCLMTLNNQVKAYETEKGSAAALVDQWISRLAKQFGYNEGYSLKAILKNLRKIAADFNAIPCNRKTKIKVGIVGEIYVKYTSLGNNNLEELLANQDCEIMVPGLLDFMLYTLYRTPENSRLYGGDGISAGLIKVIIRQIQKMQDAMIDAIALYPNFAAPSKFSHTKSLGEALIGTGCYMGEGWLLTAEMLDLVERGYGNIICTQPFGCLPNHICGKGMIRKVREMNPAANIVPIDYDTSATRANQENRIKLMLAVAKENMYNEQDRNWKHRMPDGRQDVFEQMKWKPYLPNLQFHG